MVRQGLDDLARDRVTDDVDHSHDQSAASKARSAPRLPALMGVINSLLVVGLLR